METPALNVHREPSLLPAEHLSRWHGFPIGLFEVAHEVVSRDITFPVPVVAMIERGSATAEFQFGGRCETYHLAADSIGVFSAGDHRRLSRWRGRHAVRILVSLDGAQLRRSGLVDDDLLDAPLSRNLAFRDPTLSAHLRQMAGEVQAGCPNGALFAESLSIGLALHLQRLQRVERGGEADTARAGRFTPAQVRRLQEHLADRLGQPLSLHDLAAVVGFSSPHFVRLFRATFGTTPHAHVMRERARLARDLVVRGDLPLALVASQAGFSSQSHLNAVFKRLFGATPGAMRRAAARH